MSNYFFGSDQQSIIGDAPRYFYGLRRTDDGTVYFVRVDQLDRTDSIEVNNLGPEEENYDDFEVGFDFFEGRDVNHNIVFENLKYEQYRWDDRPVYYYIDNDGQLVVRIDKKYTYPTGV